MEPLVAPRQLPAKVDSYKPPPFHRKIPVLLGRP